MFTSGTQAIQGRSVNDDPWPYVALWRDGTNQLRRYRTEDAAERNAQAWLYDPRPEYAVLDNPILVEYRGSVEEDLPFTEPDIWACNLRDRGPGAWSYATPEQIDHARRVLEKLAVVYA